VLDVQCLVVDVFLLPGCLGVWVFGCLGVWVFGCLGVWVFWLLECLRLKLFSFAFGISRNTCLNINRMAGKYLIIEHGGAGLCDRSLRENY